MKSPRESAEDEILEIAEVLLKREPVLFHALLRHAEILAQDRGTGYSVTNLARKRLTRR